MPHSMVPKKITAHPSERFGFSFRDKRFAGNEKLMYPTTEVESVLLPVYYHVITKVLQNMVKQL